VNAVISTTDAKSFLRVDHSDEDSLIDALVAASTKACENFADLKFINQSWQLWLDSFPIERTQKASESWSGVRQGPITDYLSQKREVQIPIRPVSSITSLKTYDESDTESTFSTSAYIADVNSQFRYARVALRDNYVWPVDLRSANSIVIDFVAGFGANSTDVPEDILQAVKLTLADFYENRDDRKEKQLPGAARSILSAYRVLSV
jgi:hypothetical protein